MRCRRGVDLNPSALHRNPTARLVARTASPCCSDRTFVVLPGCLSRARRGVRAPRAAAGDVHPAEGLLASLATAISGCFPIVVVTSALLGVLRPTALTWVPASWMSPFLGLSMLGMGLTLTFADFKRVLAAPRNIMLGVCLQYSVMPSLAFVISRALALPLDLTIGLCIVGACPGGTASNVVTYLAKADVPLSVAMTTASTVGAVVMTPLLTSLLLGTLVQVDALGLLLSTVQVVLLPVALGTALNQAFPRTIERLTPLSTLSAVMLIALICGRVMAQNSGFFAALDPRLLLGVFLLHAGGFVLGYSLSKLVRMEEKAARTNSIEVGMQNSALGAMLATQHFGAMHPLAAVPCAISAVMHSCMGSLLAAYWYVPGGDSLFKLFKPFTITLTGTRPRTVLQGTSPARRITFRTAPPYRHTSLLVEKYAPVGSRPRASDRGIFQIRNIFGKISNHDVMLNSNGKRHYCIDDIINDSKSSKSSKRPPLGDATNYCLPNIAERKGAVARSDEVAGPRGENARDAARGTSEIKLDVESDVESVVESLLPCRKISLRGPAPRAWWSGGETRRLAASFPDVHVFPQRPIKAVEVLDADSLHERHYDWCEAFRAAYLRGCRLYVTHSTFTAVFWAERGVAVVSRATIGFKRLLEAHCVLFDDLKSNGRQRLVMGRSLRPGGEGGKSDKGGMGGKSGKSGKNAGFSGAAALHALYDLIMNEVVGAGVQSKRSDIFKGDFPRLYCEEPFRHSSAMVWEETLDRKRGEVQGYLPAWVLDGLLERGSVASFERMVDL